MPRSRRRHEHSATSGRLVGPLLAPIAAATTSALTDETSLDDRSLPTSQPPTRSVTARQVHRVRLPRSARRPRPNTSSPTVMNGLRRCAEATQTRARTPVAALALVLGPQSAPVPGCRLFVPGCRPSPRFCSRSNGAVDIAIGRPSTPRPSWRVLDDGEIQYAGACAGHPVAHREGRTHPRSREGLAAVQPARHRPASRRMPRQGNMPTSDATSSAPVATDPIG